MAKVARYLFGIYMAVVVAAAFLWLPPAQGFQSEPLARILAFHLPNAVLVLVAAFAAAAYGWRFLRHRRPLDDARSKTAAALAIIFCLLTTVTGMIFAKVQWGAYWNWDPKQTCIFILMLIFAAYFVLRSGVEDPDKRGVVAAVYILFAAVMTPMLGYVVPKFMTSLHPKNTQLDPKYHTVVWGFTLALLVLYFWMQSIAVRYERVRLALEAAEERGS